MGERKLARIMFHSFTFLLILVLVSWCDAEQETSRIIGGSEVQDGEAPWQVALERVSGAAGAFICGGCWIGNRTVITAAHCVFGWEDYPQMFQIHFNTIDLSDNHGATMPVRRIIMHPAFTRGSMDWDVAILLLDGFLLPDVNAKLIDISQLEAEPGEDLLATGWGQTEPSPHCRSPPTLKLMKTALRAISRNECKETWRDEWPVVTENMFCASTTTGSSTCHGDSGGPVIATKTGHLLGLVSWGDRFCATSPQTPNVFTKLARPEIREWITINLFN